MDLVDHCNCKLSVIIPCLHSTVICIKNNWVYGYLWDLECSVKKEFEQKFSDALAIKIINQVYVLKDENN